MVLREISEGRIAGTGTLKAQSRICGGVNITADGTNAAVVVLRKKEATGKIVFSISTKTPLGIFAPFDIGSDDLYYDISGTGAAAEIYEYVP